MKAIMCLLNVLVAAVCINCEMPPELKQAAVECRTEIGTPSENPKGSPNMDDPKFKCFLACVMKKLGDMVDGKLLPEKLIELRLTSKPNADSSSVQENIRECATKANKESDECEVTGVFLKCIREEKFGPSSVS